MVIIARKRVRVPGRRELREEAKSLGINKKYGFFTSKSAILRDIIEAREKQRKQLEQGKKAEEDRQARLKEMEKEKKIQASRDANAAKFKEIQEKMKSRQPLTAEEMNFYKKNFSRYIGREKTELTRKEKNLFGRIMEGGRATEAIPMRAEAMGIRSLEEAYRDRETLQKQLDELLERKARETRPSERRALTADIAELNTEIRRKTEYINELRATEGRKVVRSLSPEEAKEIYGRGSKEYREALERFVMESWRSGLKETNKDLTEWRKQLKKEKDPWERERLKKQIEEGEKELKEFKEKFIDNIKKKPIELLEEV
ncbi:MAG: hypothetical protein QXO69_01875 [archaeon]